MKMSEDNSLKFSRFDGTNFSNWKYRIQILLDEKDLLKYIERDLQTLLADGSQQSHHTTKEKKAKSLLIQYISDGQLEYVKDYKRAKDIFDALTSVFERKSVAGQIYLRKKLMTLKYNDDTLMSTHFLEFDKTVRELKSIGATVEEMDIICYLLLSLPKSYDTIVTAIETIDSKTLSLDFVKTRLLDEFNKRKNNEHESDTDNGGVAMHVKSRKFQFKCY